MISALSCPVFGAILSGFSLIKMGDQPAWEASGSHFLGDLKKRAKNTIRRNQKSEPIVIDFFLWQTLKR